MSRALLVTQSTRSIGEFRRPWVRRLFRRYLVSFRRRLGHALNALAREGEVTLLTSRQLVDVASLPPEVHVRYFDDESFRVSGEEVVALTRHLTRAWWPAGDREPELVYRGVWLPDVAAIGRAIVFRLEIAEPFVAIERIFQETRPTRVVALGGTSIPEQLARCVAQSRALPFSVAAPGFLTARLYARAYAMLFAREERLRVSSFLAYPRRPPMTGIPSDAERLLFVTCRPRHHYVVDPLVTALGDAHVDTHVVTAPSPERELGERVRALRGAGVPADWLTDYLPRDEATALVRHYRPRLRALWRRLDRDPALATRLTWNGTRLNDVVRPFLRNWVERSLLAAVLFQEAAVRATEAIRPSAVVITSNRRLAERAVALVARVRGIPCIHFSGALLYSRDPSSSFDLADRIMVIGEHLRERLVQEGLAEPHRISVVGDPRSAAARAALPSELRAAVERHFGLTPGRRLLVLVSKYVSLAFSAAEKEAFYRTVTRGLGLLEPADVVVKVHPNEDEVLLRRQAREWGWPGTVFTQSYDIHRLFAAADAAIMVTSMAGIEAMAQGCPVVAVQTPGKDFEGQGMPPYVSEAVVERVDMGDPEGLARAVRRVMHDTDARATLVERARKFAARYDSPFDREPAKRLLTVIGEVRAERQEAAR